jgi:hypothetical protein
MIAEDKIQAIKSASIVQVIGHYLPLKKKGVNYICSCPFHDEKTPSFTVNPTRNAFKCFGCGERGDAIQFVMKHEGKTFTEAVQIIASLSNIIIEGEQPITITRKPKQPKKVNRLIEFDTIPHHIRGIDLADMHRNSLCCQFIEMVGERVVREVFQTYGVSIEGSTVVIPQNDIHGNCRTAKKIEYGKGAKRTAIPKWLHTDLIKKGILPASFRLRQCFTGEHLLSRFPGRRVAIVESQSTMLFMVCLGLAAEYYNISHLKYFNSFVWLSTGGVNGVSWKDESVSSVLKGRQVILFPDAGFNEQWAKDAEVMKEYGIKVCVSDLIEKKYQNGTLKYNEDLRDYFLQFSREIAETCYKATVEIEIHDMLPNCVVTNTGEKFGNLISASFWLKDGRFVDVLYDMDGELILYHPFVKPLSEFFNKNFIPGKIDGQDCLINIVNN